MKKLRLQSGKRVVRTIYIDPVLDAWIERLSLDRHVSYSEMVNQLLAEHYELRSGTGKNVMNFLEQFREQLCKGLDNVWEEMGKLKANLYLLETMQDKEVALLGLGT